MVYRLRSTICRLLFLAYRLPRVGGFGERMGNGLAFRTPLPNVTVSGWTLVVGFALSLLMGGLGIWNSFDAKATALDVRVDGIERQNAQIAARMDAQDAALQRIERTLEELAREVRKDGRQ